ncbi:MAG TPA: hypothetical protein VGK10_21270 [Prolixibacteraceae bacterium]|jgi:hypothetical protein
MKKILLIAIMSILFFGCKKDEDSAKTTYQISNNTTRINTSSDPYLNGTMWEIVVYCYIGSDIVRQDNIVSVSPGGGKSDMIEVPSNYEKIKVSFKFLPPQSAYYDLSLNNRKYVVAYTLLGKGKNSIVSISDDTMSGPTLNSSIKDTKKVINKAIKEQLDILKIAF